MPQLQKEKKRRPAICGWHRHVLLVTFRYDREKLVKFTSDKCGRDCMVFSCSNKAFIYTTIPALASLQLVENAP